MTTPTGVPIAPTEVPARASGVVLHGPVSGSGYQRPPSLVVRGDGQAVQLTPLLYAVLDAIDGRRTWEQIASVVGTHAVRPVSVEDVRYLAVHKLEPAGLLRLPNGSDPVTTNSSPLLGLRFRLVVSNPAVTSRIAAPFAVLFSPWIMVPVLVAFAASTWWTIAVRGLGTAFDSALYQPELLLAVIVATIASAGFHEVGHAAACRWSGVRPGAMGAALYLVWPVFYTDVTESYRLGRGGRLRVDLGGVYFNAVFSVVAFALWGVTGADGLLLIIPLQLFQVLRQMIPLVRFDGYHILADLTGVPDLFARIRPTLGALVGRRQGTAPPLKRGVRLVVLGWVAVVVPALLGLFALMVWNLPSIVRSTLGSVTHHARALVVNATAGDAARVGLGVIAILGVALVPLGIAVLLARVARQAGRGFWSATDGHPATRAMTAVLVLVLVAVAGPAWMPSPTPPQGGDLASAPGLAGAEPATADPAEVAERLRTRVERAPAVRRPMPPPQPTVDVPTVEDVDAQTLEVAGDPASTGPTLVLAQVDDWPFPFDPPAGARPGDNVVVAVNLVDGDALFEMTSQLSWIVEGSVADPRNVAMAVSSCQGCTTTAVAFQVVLTIGRVDVAVPMNEAVAVNQECASCVTEAVAVQLMVTLEEAPSAEVMAQIDAIWAQVTALEVELEGQPPEVIHEELARVRHEIVQVVASGGAVVADPAVAGGEADLLTAEGEALPADGLSYARRDADGPSFTPFGRRGPDGDHDAPFDDDAPVTAGGGADAESPVGVAAEDVVAADPVQAALDLVVDDRPVEPEGAPVPADEPTGAAPVIAATDPEDGTVFSRR